MKVLRKANLESALQKLAETADVFVPIQRGPVTGFFSFKTYNEDFDDLMLDVLNVYQPPKNIIIPPKEKGFEIDQAEKAIQPKVIFGARSCDIQALTYLDEVYSTNVYENNFYKARRDKTTIVANACYHPGPSCFCKSMGVNPLEAASADVIIHDVGKEGYVWDCRTEKGEALTAPIADLLDEKTVEFPEMYPFDRKLDWQGTAEKLAELDSHPFWEKRSEACVTCTGVCTYSCPVCYCFESQHAVWKKEGYDFPCYASCLYQEPAVTADRQQMHQQETERFRSRFMHKLRFYPEKYGRPLCTGCGRCIVVCPAEGSIDKVITFIKENE